jgi:hypothetical protein
MSPKKPKDFIKPTAESLEVSESIVDDVVSFYWSSVRKALSDMEGPSITVANLGTFKARYKKIPALEKKYQHYLNNMSLESMTFNKHTVQKLAQTKLEGLKRIQEQMEEDYQRKLETREKRKNYVTNQDLERKREHTGRDQEQDF